MKVYVMERGCYEGRNIAGIYASAEAAMAAYPVEREARVGQSPYKIERSGGWQQDKYGDWNNGLDWDSAATIYEYEVEGD